MCSCYLITPFLILPPPHYLSFWLPLFLSHSLHPLSNSLSLSLSLSLSSLSLSLLSLPHIIFETIFHKYSKRRVHITLLLPMSLVTVCRYFFLVFLNLPLPHYLSFCLPLFLSFSLNLSLFRSLSLSISLSISVSLLLSTFRLFSNSGFFLMPFGSFLNKYITESFIVCV